MIFFSHAIRNPWKTVLEIQAIISLLFVPRDGVSQHTSKSTINLKFSNQLMLSPILACHSQASDTNSSQAGGWAESQMTALVKSFEEKRWGLVLTVVRKDDSHQGKWCWILASRNANGVEKHNKGWRYLYDAV